MWTLRVVVAIVMFVIAVALAIAAAFAERYWSALAFIAAGLSISYAVLTWEGIGSNPSAWATLFSSVLTVASLFDVLTSSHAFNQDEANAQADFNVLMISRVDLTAYTEVEKKLIEDARVACTAQPGIDYRAFGTESQKAIHFGPGLTTLDGIASSLAHKQPSRCLDFYRELRKTQGPLFKQLEEDHPWLKD
ncbi:hypothetical protein DYL59_12935 [Pseudomonas kairouanensis]|uniref:Uncharacterized protein n=1 Tax=Pseudomonas kairouanensis TaxID=2293832 RepID=A0A4Z0ARQ3_9PSED|nr:hypothetical protein [Pseudomonas kairouanensis]TFY89077.1 hypothetical protein DYL59_12935 [Pseudomonas kairouanensis]